MATIITTVEPTTVTVGFDDDVTIETTTQTVSIEVEVAGPQGGQGPVPILTSTVATGTTIGSGSKTFTVVANLSLNVGEYVRICDATTPTRYMAGYITSYSGTTLVVNVIAGDTAGSGALGAGILSITGPRGATGAGYSDVTSSSSFAISTGAKSFALTTVLGYHAYVIGQRVRVSNTSSNYMEGTITAVSSTVMVVSVTAINGSGTYSFWTFGIAGSPGIAGSSGIIGVDSGELTNTGTSTAAQLGLATAGTAGTYTKVTTDAFGRVTDGTTLVASDLPSASTSAAGIVQLTDSVASTSVTTAATPKNVKTANDAASAAQTTASNALGIANAALPLDGSLSMTGTLDMFGQSIMNVVDTETATVTFNGPTTNAQISNSANSSAVVQFPGASGTLIATSDTATVTNTMLAGSIAATKISGTAYTRSNKNTEEYRLAGTFDILPRLSVTTTRAMVNGTIYTTLFTPTESFTMTNFVTFTSTGGTDTGGTTVRRMGLFTVSGTTLTLVARTASDSTLWNASNTLYTRALSTTGGYPSTYTLNAGTTYAFGMIAYNTGGTFAGPLVSSGFTTTQTLQPYIALGLTSQTDIPTSATAFATNQNNAVFARLT